jgi:mono/diheme cytochrome c family protein
MARGLDVGTRTGDRGERTRVLTVTSLLLAATGMLSAACAATDVSGGGEPLAGGDAARGGELFAATCASCHGTDLQGTGTGPPLIHEYYVPSHHPDAAILMAVQRGVQPHHWDFGAMPPVPALSVEEVADIVAYVRQRQRDAGLIE